MTDTVLISGGSAYIAGFLIRQLVAEGWMVHTTVRSLAKESAVRQLLAVDDSRLEFFAADLNADAGWAESMAGCGFVPTGSPRKAPPSSSAPSIPQWCWGRCGAETIRPRSSS